MDVEIKGEEPTILDLARKTYAQRMARLKGLTGKEGTPWALLSDVSKLAEYRNVEDMVKVLRTGGWVILNTETPPLVPQRWERTH